MGAAAQRKPLRRETLRAELERRYGTSAAVRELIAAALVQRRRWRQARRRLEREGLTIDYGQGPVRHPLIVAEGGAQRLFVTLLEKLEYQTRRTKVGAPTKVERLPSGPTLSARAAKYLATPGA